MSGEFLKTLGCVGGRAVLEKYNKLFVFKAVKACVGTGIAVANILKDREGALRGRETRASASAMDRSVVSEFDSDSPCVLAVSKGCAQETSSGPGAAKDKNTKVN